MADPMADTNLPSGESIAIEEAIGNAEKDLPVDPLPITEESKSDPSVKETNGESKVEAAKSPRKRSRSRSPRRDKRRSRR